VANFENNVEPQWGEKKEQALTAWLTQVLTPPIEVDDPEDDARPRLVDPKEDLAAMKTAIIADRDTEAIPKTYKQITAAVKIQIWWKGVLVRRQREEERWRKRALSSRQNAIRRLKKWWKRIRAFHQEQMLIAEEKSAAWYIYKRGILIRRLLRMKQEDIAKETARRRKSIGRRRKAILLRRQAKKEREALAQVIEGRWKPVVASRQAQLAIAEDRRRKAEAATQIQAWWKGALLRRQLRMEQAVIVLELRQRMSVTRMSVTEDQKIAVRTRNGLGYLLDHDSLSYIRKGLEELEVVTRLLAGSCIQLVERGATDVLFKVIHEMNMGLASRAVTTLAVSILFNLAKFDATRDQICNVDQWFSKLVDLLQKLHNLPDGGRQEIFTKTCMILIILRQLDVSAPEINDSKMALNKIRSIYTEFKNREDRRKQEERTKLLKERGKAEVVLRGHRNAPPPSPFWELQPIRFTPDWMLVRDKPKEHLSKEEAIDWLAYAYKDKLN